MLEARSGDQIVPNFCPRYGTVLVDEIKFGKLRHICPLYAYIYGRDP